MEKEFENDTNYLDQHFLIDKSIINAFIDASNLKIDDKVVEIGPGKCEISDIIARKVNFLTCIEIDRNLEHFINVLKDKHDNVDVIYGNALNVFIPKCNKIISSLPYSITEPFIEKLIRCDFDCAILIVGKKFADSVIDKKITKLALLTNSFFRVEKIMDIGPDAFDPMPRVMSSMIKLYPIKREELNYSFKKFIFRELFFNRNRKLKNNLMEALIEFVKLHDKKLTKKESKAIIEEYNLPKEMLNKMMENLSNEEYQLLYDALK
ncbi:MAG: rRNA adenine N-6-methyltransferase family protein [Bacilli bacterium]